jgi:hypothetical protein
MEIFDIGDRRGFERGFLKGAAVVAVKVARQHVKTAKGEFCFGHGRLLATVTRPWRKGFLEAGGDRTATLLVDPV